jgi:hypothetical protein
MLIKLTMNETTVICCCCDEHFAIEDTRRIKTQGLAQSFHICNHCLEEVPLLKEQLEEIIDKREELRVAG